MDELKQDIEKKRKLNSISGTLPTGTKYMRLGDRQEMERQRLQEAQCALDEERKRRELAELKATEEKAKAKSESLNSTDRSKTSVAKKELIDPSSSAARISSLTISQVKTRLRAFGQPISLFAETDEERRERLSLVFQHQVRGLD